MAANKKIWQVCILQEYCATNREKKIHLQYAKMKGALQIQRTDNICTFSYVLKTFLSSLFWTFLMWFSFSTFPGTKFVINGHFTLIFGCGKLQEQVALKKRLKMLRTQKKCHSCLDLYKNKKICFLFEKCHKWLI